MIERFQRQMTRLVGCPRDGRYLLAVSGGADSMVMAHLFLLSGYHFAIAHCNFHLRGEDSDRDMRFVQQWSDNHHVDCFVKEFDTLSEKERTGESVEMAARRLRYHWFEEIGKDFDYVVTAHQADDAAETVLLNLTRGTGLKGLAGIPEKSGKLLRPMLSFGAEEIRLFAKEHHIDYVTDVTNADEQIKRNRIRHSVMPALRTLNPNLTSTFAHNIAILQQQYGIYKSAVEQIISQAVTQDGDTVHIHREVIEAHPCRETLLFEILQPYGFTDAIVRDILKPGQTGRIFHAPQHTLVADRTDFVVQPVTPQKEERVFQDLESLKSFFDIELQQAQPLGLPCDNRTFLIAPNKLKFPVTLRTWRHGDFFYPFGGKGKRKLSDFFIDQKINRLQKEKVLLFCIEGDIAWVVGYRSDERFKVTDTEAQYYRITLRQPCQFF